MSVSHHTFTGRLNLFSNERSQQVVLRTPAGNISELWSEGDAPYAPDQLPSEVLDAIEARLNEYLFASSKPEKLKTIAAICERINEFDVDWCVQMAKWHEAKAADFRAIAKATGEQQ